MTVIGLESPPVQNEFQTLSILLFNSPVTIMSFEFDLVVGFGGEGKKY